MLYRMKSGCDKSSYTGTKNLCSKDGRSMLLHCTSSGILIAFFLLLSSCNGPSLGIKVVSMRMPLMPLGQIVPEL